MQSPRILTRRIHQLRCGKTRERSPVSQRTAACLEAYDVSQLAQKHVSETD
jgi:hypothetical protein